RSGAARGRRGGLTQRVLSHPLRRHAAAGLLVLAVATTACSGAATGAAARRASHSSKTAPASSTTVPTTTAPPDITPVATPDGVSHVGYQWYTHPAPGGSVLLAVRHSGASPLSRPAVILDDTSGGFNLDYLTFADNLV